MAIAFSYGSRLLTTLRLGWWSNANTGAVRQGVAGSPPDRSPGWTFSFTRPTVQAKPTAPAPLIAPTVKPDAIYTPLAQPVLLPAPQVAPSAPAPVVVTTGVEAAQPKPCSDCGGQVTDATPAAPAPVPAPSASVVATDTPAPAPSSPAAPAPATPPKAKAGRGWVLALGIVAVIVAGLALASFVRPRT